MDKREPSHTVGGNLNWCNYYGEQYGGSQARGPIGATATGLRQSHSNAGSEPRFQPTPQLRATPDC